MLLAIAIFLGSSIVLLTTRLTHSRARKLSILFNGHREVNQLTRMDFVVLDELGYLPFAQTGSQLLFHRSAGSTSAPRSSSRPIFFAEWPEAVRDPECDCREAEAPIQEGLVG